ncbi:hypothetical protein [Amycolatopsis sp. NPDC004378]
MTTAKTSATAMLERIRAHYIKPIKVQPGGHVREDDLLPGAVVLAEVPAPGTSGRRIDALAIGLTRARAGLDGFEIKVSRNDWLHELDQARKADAWFGHTHRWWVVAPSTEIVRSEELPEGWGLMVPDPRSARRLKVVTKAATRTPILDWSVLWEIAKKLDRNRADEVKAAAAAVREHMLAETAEQVKRAALAMHSPTSDQTRIGIALAEATGLEPWDLSYTLEQSTSWTQEALTAIFAAARATERRRDHGWLTEQAKHLADEHRKTADALLAAAAALEPTALTAEQRERGVSA